MAGRTGGRHRRCDADPGGRRRAIPGLRPMRRPRVSLANSHSGGAGAPPGGTTAPRQELADGRAADAQAFAKSRTKSAARRRNENAAVERREASGQRHCPRRASQGVNQLDALRGAGGKRKNGRGPTRGRHQEYGRRSVGFAGCLKLDIGFERAWSPRTSKRKAAQAPPSRLSGVRTTRRQRASAE